MDDGCALAKGFHQNFSARQFVERAGKGHLVVVCKILIEPLQMRSLDAQIELGDHDISKLLNRVYQAEEFQIEAWQTFQKGGNFVENIKINTHLVPDSGMLNLDGDLCTLGIQERGLLEASLVDLGDASRSNRSRMYIQGFHSLFSELILQNCLCFFPRVPLCVVLELGKVIAEFWTEQILPSGCPLCHFDPCRTGLFDSPQGVVPRCFVSSITNIRERN
mmetsp:Transcript_4397/g.9172  ORF Transcript_4397/g.9172 Transcript_4397/m.9172 type:complete len:220 (-) Transcript_4397:249-908(-)